jgi:hypothetical protein
VAMVIVDAFTSFGVAIPVRGCGTKPTAEEVERVFTDVWLAFASPLVPSMRTRIRVSEVCSRHGASCVEASLYQWRGVHITNWVSRREGFRL